MITLDETYRLVAAEEGNLRRHGYEEPAMQVVARNDGVLVCKLPGYSFNMSGIRGLRDDHYVASEMRAFKIVRQDTDWLIVTGLISWPTSKPRT